MRKRLGEAARLFCAAKKRIRVSAIIAAAPDDDLPG